MRGDMMTPWSLLAGLALLLSGCWADFPESRFSLNDSTVTRPDSRRDGSRPDQGPGDLPTGEARDLMTKDTPTTDSDLPVSDLPGDALVSDLPKPDVLKPDLLKPDVLKPDVFSCTPGAFIRCATSKTLSRCNSNGDGVISINCGAASCVVSLQRCDQCDPASAPTCQGASVRTCSINGLFTTTLCALGCKDGACCVDGDKDGSSCDDCDDADKNAFPGQTSYFAVPRVGGGYDFNCSGTPEREFPNLVACVGAGGNCGGDGWVGSVPACGQAGQFATCLKDAGNCVQQTATTQTQTCR